MNGTIIAGRYLSDEESQAYFEGMAEKTSTAKLRELVSREDAGPYTVNACRKELVKRGV